MDENPVGEVLPYVCILGMCRARDPHFQPWISVPEHIIFHFLADYAVPETIIFKNFFNFNPFIYMYLPSTAYLVLTWSAGRRICIPQHAPPPPVPMSVLFMVQYVTDVFMNWTLNIVGKYESTLHCQMKANNKCIKWSFKLCISATGTFTKKKKISRELQRESLA